MLVDTTLFETLVGAIKESSSFTTSPMSFTGSEKLQKGLALSTENGTERYILKYQTLTNGFTWFNIVPDAKGGTA